MSTIAIIVVFFALGLCARVLVAEPAHLVRWLNNFIIYISLPAIILSKVPFLNITAEVLVPVAFAWLWLLIGWFLVRAICRHQQWPRQLEGALVMLVVMGNTSYLGLPLIQAAFGNGALAYAIFYDQLGGFLMLSTVGLLLVALYAPGENEGKPDLRRVLRNVVTFPPIITLVVALLVPIEPLVSALANELSLIGRLLLPAALFVLGIQFQARLLPEHRKPLVIGISLKMILAPVVATLYILVLGSSYEVRVATVFEAAMPCMITPGLLAMNAGIAPRFIAALLGYSTVFAFISLPIVYLLLS